jgi:hypothetical protein
MKLWLTLITMVLLLQVAYSFLTVHYIIDGEVAYRLIRDGKTGVHRE